MIFFFPKSKLESIDSILPLIYDLKKNYSTDSIVIFQNQKDLELIKKNIFIYDTLKTFSNIRVIKKKNIILNKFRVILLILYLFFKTLFRSKIIHFTQFDQWPFKIISLLFPQNIYRCNSNSYHDERRNLINKILILNEANHKPVGKNIIALNEEFKNKFNDGDNIIFEYKMPRLRKFWHDYVKDNSHIYLEKYHPKYSENKKIIFFAITSLHNQGFIRDGTSIKIFNQILNLLDKKFKDHLIFIKPHPTTNLKTLHELTKDKKNVEITFLHPSLLSYKASFFICDLFSTVTTDAYYLGLTTIEYSIYDRQTLKLTNNKSVGKNFVDYFFHEDLHSLENLFEGNFIKKKKQLIYSDFDDLLIKNLLN